MTEQATWQHGGVVYPLPASGTSALKDADPALYYLLDYSQSVLQTYMGARIASESTKAGLASPNAITGAVKYAIPYDPRTVALESSIGRWPLLAIWRESQKYRWRTVCRMETVSTLRVAYMLPPLAPAQYERLRPLLNSVPKILLGRIENKFDPAYQNGADFLALAGIDEIDLSEDGWGSYQVSENQSNVLFPAWFGTITLIERDEDYPAAATGGAFAGTDIEIDDVSGGTPLDLVDLQANIDDPTQIVGLRALYRGDAGITRDTSQVLAVSIADQSTNALTATAPTASNRPYILGETSPLPITFLRFDGAATYMMATDATLGADTAKTLVALFRLTDITSRSSIVLVTDGTAGATVAIEANTNGTGKLGLALSGSYYDTQFSADTEWHVAILRISSSVGSIASTAKLQIDDLPAVLTLKSGTGTWASIATATTISLGGLSSDLAHTAAHADLGVAMVFAADLSDSDAVTCASFCKAWLAGT